MPINYDQIFTNQATSQQDGSGTVGTSGSGLASGQGTPRRSLSQTLLSQMSSPTASFGLTARSPSPSPFINGALGRTRSINNRGFMSRGPSLQSLVKSFINRVSRGTQTDSDDFDTISIASMASGFSAIANDLTQSRLRLYLNDNHTNQSKSYASSHVDDNEFVEELQKLRDEINGEFGTEPAYTVNQFEIEEESEPQSVCEKKGYRKADAATSKVITCDRNTETNVPSRQDNSTQTETPKKTLLVEKAIETEPEIVPGKPLTNEGITQTVEPVVMKVAAKPQTCDSQTQTDMLKFCDHCAGVQHQHSREIPPPTKVIHEKIILQQPQPQILNCEFVISVNQYNKNCIYCLLIYFLQLAC